MTIDEAIANEREKAKIRRKELMKDFYSPQTIQRYQEFAKEHEQLAEWLEELKKLRELLDERLHEKLIYSKVAEDNYNKGYADGSLSVTSEIRNKVIDECLGVLYRNGGKIISIRFYEEIFKEMEQLKEGGNYD